MFERFTKPARATVVRATKEREAMGHDYVDTEHLLLALLSDGSAGLGHEILADAGLKYEAVRAEVLRRTTAKGLTDADAEALRSIGIDLDAVRARVEESFGPGALRTPQPAPRRGMLRMRSPFSKGARKALELGLRQGLSLHDSFIGTEHLVLGLLHEKEGLAGQIMWAAGLRLPDVRDRVREANKAA
jgi:ATP-dependent Clp protease ATP-binding subunit ClpA